LSTYIKNFTVLGRIVSLSDLIQFEGKNGPGKVFNCILMDNAGDQIQANFFNEAVDEHHHKLAKGCCYTITGASVKLSDKRYSPIDAEYDLLCFKTT